MKRRILGLLMVTAAVTLFGAGMVWSFGWSDSVLMFKVVLCGFVGAIGLFGILALFRKGVQLLFSD
jgi:hypothetical protein